MSPDRGSGTIWVLTWCMLLWFLALAILLSAGIRVERHRASAAADLAALAAAERILSGEPTACRSAAHTAAANDTRLRSCALEGPFAEVSVELPSRAWPVTLIAHARAGPADLTGRNSSQTGHPARDAATASGGTPAETAGSAEGRLAAACSAR